MHSTESPDRTAFWLIIAAMTAVWVVTAGGMVIVLAVVGRSPSVSSAGRSSVVKGTLSEWRIAADATAPAGDVTFEVTNAGTEEHEMLVLKTDTPPDQIPVTDAGDPPVPVTTGADKIDEATSIGETGDPNLKPGDTRTFTLKNMVPGRYVLVCNLADHYKNGMRAAFTVTP